MPKPWCPGHPFPQHPPIIPLSALLSTRDFWHFFCIFILWRCRHRSESSGTATIVLSCLVLSLFFLPSPCCRCGCLTNTHTHTHSCLIFMGHLRRQRRAACLCIRKIHFRFGLSAFARVPVPLLRPASLASSQVRCPAVGHVYIVVCTTPACTRPGLRGLEVGAAKYRFRSEVSKFLTGCKKEVYE